MPNIAIFNLINSSNCGDKLIAESLNSALSAFEISNYDILGNKGRGRFFYFIKRLLAVSIIPVMPEKIRQGIIFFCAFLKIRIFKTPFYRKAIKKADFIIIGGGQLFRDNDGYMACAFSSLFCAIQKYRKHFAIIGCGATANWKSYAKQTFSQILESPRNVLTVFRDEKSIEVIRNYGIKKDCHIAPDLAFIPGFKENLSENTNTLGLCLASPNTIFYYGKNKACSSVQDCRKKIIKDLFEKISSSKKANILIFCNGNPEDYRFSKNIYQLAKKRFSEKTLLLAPRPKSVKEFEKIIEKTSCIYSYRMHAAILASLKNIPLELARWDSKTDELDLRSENIKKMIYDAEKLKEKITDLINK